MPAPSQRPRIGITVGDPSGIGPEIALKASADERVRAACEVTLYGMTDADGLAAFPPGVVNAASGRASYDWIVSATADALAGRMDAIVTAPINKAAFAMAGLPWKGHTDLLGHLCGAPEVAMMFWSDRLRVVLATVHIPLADVPRAITTDGLVRLCALTAASMPRFGIERPRLALAGLNPHAGEDGLLGSEDREVMRPAVEQARARGLDVSGPYPADTLFVRASHGEFDVVVAAYHDQGLVPVKLLAFGKSVNVTLGLPIVRTSVDHGTAFDIARQGIADAGSMVEAILLAARLGERRLEAREGLKQDKA
jgi:4-hydroxythreonine-4-phosphate dehydrogenase